MALIGVAPPNPATDTGQFRYLIGDTEYTELDPPQAGMGAYEMFSDEQIVTFLALGEGSTNRAIAYAYLNLASQAALQSKTVKDTDLQVDLTKRSADLRAIAAMWFDRADDEDGANGGADIFDLHDIGEHRRFQRPEGAQWPFIGEGWRT